MLFKVIVEIVYFDFLCFQMSRIGRYVGLQFVFVYIEFFFEIDQGSVVQIDFGFIVGGKVGLVVFGRLCIFDWIFVFGFIFIVEDQWDFM